MFQCYNMTSIYFFLCGFFSQFLQYYFMTLHTSCRSLTVVLSFHIHFCLSWYLFINSWTLYKNEKGVFTAVVLRSPTLCAVCNNDNSTFRQGYRYTLLTLKRPFLVHQSSFIRFDRLHSFKDLLFTTFPKEKRWKIDHNLLRIGNPFSTFWTRFGRIVPQIIVLKA